MPRSLKVTLAPFSEPTCSIHFGLPRPPSGFRCLIPAAPAVPAAAANQQNDQYDDEKRGGVHGFDPYPFYPVPMPNGPGRWGSAEGAALRRFGCEWITQLERTRTRQALSAAKAPGVPLGNPKLAVARKSAVEAVKAEADRYAANVLPIIREAQKAGASTLLKLAG